MNHLAQVIYTRLHNKTIEDTSTTAKALSVQELAALHELETLLSLPATDLAEMLAQTDPSDWTLDIDRSGLRKANDTPT